MSDILVKYLRRSNSYNVVRKFLSDFNGLEMKLLDLEGKPVYPDHPDKLLGFAAPTPKDSGLSEEFESKTKDSPFYYDNLAVVIETQKCLSFSDQRCPAVILVPVIHKNEVICILSLEGKDVSILRSGHQQVIIALVQDMIKHIVEQDFLTLEDFQGTDQTAQQKTMCRIIKFVCENYQNNELTLSQVAVENNISYHYLCHLFKKELKTTFSDYLNDVRLNTAAKLLKDKNLTVSQVCYFCGYSDPCYFSKIFKKWFGVSPANVRNKKYKFPQPRFKAVLRELQPL